MHTAFAVSTLVEKMSLTIVCLESYAHGTKLLAGTNEGVLLAYDVTPSDKPGQAFSAELTTSKRTFARKAIEQLQAIEELDLLLSLSDSVISLHDLSTLNPRSQIAKSKGANLFALDVPPKAAPAVSPIQSLTGRPAPGGSAAGRSSTLQSVTPPAYRLCVSARKKLLLFEWNGTEFAEGKEFPAPDKARTIVWHNDKLCVGYAKEYNIVNTTTSAVAELFAIKQGKAIAAKLPRNEILLSKDTFSIFVNADDGKPTRKFGLNWNDVPETFGYCFPYIVGIIPRGVEVRTIETQATVQSLPQLAKARVMTTGEVIYVAAASYIWRLVPVSLATQVEELVTNSEFEEAIALLDQVTDMPIRQREDKLRSVRRQYAYHSFAKKNFEKAIVLFQEINADPVEVISLYPSFATELRTSFNAPIRPPRLEGPDLEKATVALIKFLTDRRTMLSKLSKQDEESFVEQAQQLLQAQAEQTAQSNGRAPAVIKPYTDEAAAGAAPPMSTSLKEMAQIIDTTLLKAYLATNASLVGPLLRLPNQCNLAESVALLQQHRKYNELVELYFGKELHTDALQLLAKFGQTPNGPLSGPSHTVAYLQRLGGQHVDLILQFSTWVLKSDMEEGFRVFTEDYPGSEKLPRDVILNHLYQNAPSLTVRYLEHIVLQRKDTTPEFHNQLLSLYIDAAKGELGTAGPQDKPSAARQKLINLLDQSTSYAPERILPRLPDSALQERAILLSRLGQHDAALMIYAYKMRSFKMAEEYCQKNYDPEREDARDVYLSLLRVYLKPEGEPKDIASLIEPALELLSKHYSKMDAAKALELLPPTLNVSKLFPFIKAVLQEDSRQRHDGLVMRNLLKSEHLQVQEQLIHYRSRRVRVDKDTMCPVCNKRIGNSAFASFPNNSVVHYICAKAQQRAAPASGPGQ